MKCCVAFLLCASAALPQNQPNEVRLRYRQQGAEVLKKEQTRSKANLCADSEKGGNSQIARCLADQGKVTEENYLAYIRSIGALLRLASDSESAQLPPKRLAFDSAEEAWQQYRDKSCASMATQWEGGDQAPVAYSDCRLKLTWNHMNELADLYSDLWDGTTLSPTESAVALPPALVSVVSEIKAKSRIALLLPSELPQPVAKAKYATVETASENKYAISLYYDLGVGDSGFAASFGAEAHPNYELKDLPNVREVKLSHGTIGYFRPVSCGGSCAPANLWWEENQILYQVQLKLTSTLPEDDQQREITTVANSAILTGAR